MRGSQFGGDRLLTSPKRQRVNPRLQPDRDSTGFTRWRFGLVSRACATRSLTALAVGEPLVVEAQEVQDGGVQVVHVDLVLHGLVAELVGRSEGVAGLDAGAGEPDGEAVGVVVAAGAVLLGVRGAAELAPPPDE